jgi:hypothetical protein
MKNSISQKYSILILVILILILVYIHIPNPPNIMKGGAEIAEGIKNMIKNDAIYSNTLGHPIIQWVILVLVIGLIIGAYFTASGPFTWTGAPLIGVTGVSQSYAALGPGFLKKFYVLTNDTFMGRGNDPTFPEDMETYKNNLVDFKTTMKSQINVFCNAVLPCNNCQCPGYEGPECGPEAGSPADKIKKESAKDVDKFLGIVPKCCCLKRIKDGGWKSVKDRMIAVDYTHPCWIKTEKENKAYPSDQDGGQPKRTTYSWSNNSACTALLEDNPATPKPDAKIHGCDVSGGELTDGDKKIPIETGVNLNEPKLPADASGNTPPDTKLACKCEDGDPTLNFYTTLTTPNPNLGPNVTLSDELKKRNLTKLFITWGYLDIKNGKILGETEKSYRVKFANLPSTVKLDDCYFKAGTKEILQSATDKDGYLLSTKIDDANPTNTASAPKYTLDTAAYGANEFPKNDFTTFCNDDTSGANENPLCPKNGSGSIVAGSSAKVKLLYDASYMNKRNKYLYILPKTTLFSPDISEPEPEFKKLVKEQLAAVKTSMSPSSIASSKSTFFGGIYNSIFPQK